jgi:hypothetical protein
MSTVLDEYIVTLDQVEEVFKKNPRGYGYCSDEANEFPAKLGFTERCQISQVFIHIRKLKDLGRLRRVRSEEREPRQNPQNLSQNVWRYRFEYVGTPERPERVGDRTTGYFVR